MVTMPRPNYLRPVAGIKFEMSSFSAYISQFKHFVFYLCSILNKYRLVWFESLLVFIWLKF